MERLSGSETVVGTRRLIKAIEAGRISVAYIADDADLMIKTRVRAACVENGVRVIEGGTMSEIGKRCGIEVKAAAAGLVKQ